MALGSSPQPQLRPRSTFSLALELGLLQDSTGWGLGSGTALNVTLSAEDIRHGSWELSTASVEAEVNFFFGVGIEAYCCRTSSS